MPLPVWFSVTNNSLLLALQKPQVPATVRGVKRKLPELYLQVLFLSIWRKSNISSSASIYNCGMRIFDSFRNAVWRKHVRNRFWGMLQMPQPFLWFQRRNMLQLSKVWTLRYEVLHRRCVWRGGLSNLLYCRYNAVPALPIWLQMIVSLCSFRYFTRFNISTANAIERLTSLFEVFSMRFFLSTESCSVDQEYLQK